MAILCEVRQFVGSAGIESNCYKWPLFTNSGQIVRIDARLVTIGMNYSYSKFK